MIYKIEKVEIHCTINITQPGSADILEALGILGEKVMATKEEVIAAVEAEAAEVKSRVDALEAQVQALKDAAAASGSTQFAAELGEILVAVQGIFIPLPPVEAPAV